MKQFLVDLEKWERGPLFQFYMNHMRIVMSLTVDIDVTNIKAFSENHAMRFYPIMLWVVSKIINSHDEFKYGWGQDGHLIRWDYVSPSYIDFHSQDENFTKLVTEYSDDVFEFYGRAIADMEKHQRERAMIPDQPENFFDVSCLPWVKYRHIDFHVFDEGKFLAPVVTWGKYETES